MNVKVGLALDIIGAVQAGEKWLRTPDGKAHKVKRIRRVHDPYEEEIDFVLEGKSGVVLGEFNDIRVKLDMDTWEMPITDVQGNSHVLIFTACEPA